MILCLQRIVSTIYSINSGFCPRVILSTLESVHLGCFLLGIGPYATVATWHSTHVGLFLLFVLSSLDCPHFWFCLLGSPSTWDFIYFYSVLSDDSLHDELLPEDCVHSLFCPILILLTFASVYLGFCSPGWLSTWNLSICDYSHMALFPLLVLSTLDCPHLWFRLLGSPSIWDFIYFDSVLSED